MACMTGASGFIGKRLAEALRHSRELICIPHGDLRHTAVGNPDEFYFLSSYGNIFGQNERNEILKANLTDLLFILRELSSLSNCESFVYLSSSSVGLPHQTVYSRAKRAAEEVLIGLLENENFPALVIRPFSVTGVGEQPVHLIPTLIRSCFTGAPVDLVFEPKHDFIDVEDVVDGILSLVASSACGVFDLGTGRQYSNAEVLDIVQSLCGRKANIRRVDSMRPYDTDSWLSPSQGAREWGWRPRKSLESSITEMIDKYREEKRVE